MCKIGKELKLYRETLGYSLKDIYEMTGITNSRLSKIERGQLECHPSDLRKLSKVYGIKLVHLYVIAEYLALEDLEEYQLYFKGVDALDEEEKVHIQSQIDFILSRKKQML